MKNLILILSILGGFVFTACKKEVSTVGKSGIDQDDLLVSGAIDTFQLETYMELEDSSISSNTASALLGSYNDPVFGKVSSEFYTQLRLSGFSPDFGDLSTIAIDSFVLGLVYRDYYGTLEEQKFEVYQLTESLSIDSTYYSFQTKTSNTANDWMLQDKNVLTPDPKNQIVIGDKTVDPQLRLYLNPSIAMDFMEEATNSPTSFSSNEEFLTYFKGLHVKVNNPSQAEGQGAMLSFNLTDPLSKLTIYYQQGGESKTFDFLINSDCADFNHLTFENAGKKPSLVADNPAMGQYEFYTQANYSRAVVKIPHLANIPKNSVIQYAKLELPVSFYTLDPYYPSSTLSVATKISSTDDRLYSTNVTGEYTDATKSYVIDVKDYVQQILIDKIQNQGLYIAPSKMVSSVERVVFNGPSTIYKKKPKLYIVYTTF